MLLSEFYKTYNDESACRAKVKSLRESQGIICKKCSHRSHYWKSDKQVCECKHCRFRTSLRSGTVMENSNLPFRYWFTAIAHLSNTKKSVSALEMQRLLGHKRYEPIWAMMHKLRSVMGYRDSKYVLKDEIELDEAFFESPSNSDEDSDGYGAGDKTKVLVTIESKYVESPKQPKKPKEVGYIKMQMIEKGVKGQVLEKVTQMVDPQARVLSDGLKNYKKLPDIVREHVSITCISTKSSSKALPWVHTAIANAKRLFLGIYHCISRKYIQNYLNEFCYKFNRRYFEHTIFDRILATSLSTTWYENGFKNR